MKAPPYFAQSELLLHLFNARGANTLAVEINDIVNVVAENAGRLILLQDDAVVVGKDFNGVLLLDVQNFADLDGEDDSSQLVDLANHSGRFHVCCSFFFLNFYILRKKRKFARDFPANCRFPFLIINKRSDFVNRTWKFHGLFTNIDNQKTNKLLKPKKWRQYWEKRQHKIKKEQI